MRKQMRIGVSVVVLVAAAALALTLTNAGSNSASGAETGSSGAERATSYRMPTGPEITSQEAATIAIDQARHAENPSCDESGCYLSALNVRTAHGLFGEAQAVIEMKPPSAAQLTPGNPELDEWQQSSAYLVVMTSSSSFTLDVPHPPNQLAPSGGALSMIVDAHTGFVEGRALGAESPDAAALGPVFITTAPREPVSARESGSAVAVAARGGQSPGEYIKIVGRLHVGKATPRGWRIVVGRHDLATKPEYAARTRAGGRFTVEGHSGVYEIAVKRPKGGLCGKRRVRLPRFVTTHVDLRCR